jgi:manganese oxidase
MEERTKLMMIWPVAGFLVAAAFGVGLISMAAFQRDGTPATAATEAASGTQVIEVELGDLYVEPSQLVAQPGPVTIRVTNAGAIEHNLAIDGVGATRMLQAGETDTIEVADLAAGTYAMLCEVPGHEAGGMHGTLTVAGGGEATPEAPVAMTPEEMAEHDAARTATFPAETEGKGGQPLEPDIADDGTKVFSLTAAEIEWETEPGKVVTGYAYNGQIPGPEIRVELGDRVRIELQNDLPEPTTIHHHGLVIPSDMDGVPNISQPVVMPGDSFTYEFRVRNAGSHMYHSHFNAQEQVPKGLLGAFIVEDQDDPAVDTDYAMILNDGPLGYTINGKGFPATEPLVAELGDTLRIRYMNEGLQIHPMHLHGIPQRVIAIDGYPLDAPYDADTVLVAPGSRVDVLVEATEAGAWAFHCHVLTHAEAPDGMFGMVTALIVE